jgi:hypothetical protein
VAGNREGLGDVVPAAVLVGGAEGASLGDTAGLVGVAAGEAQLASDASRRSDRGMVPLSDLFVRISVTPM